jgi:hypothetical protein
MVAMVAPGTDKSRVESAPHRSSSLGDDETVRIVSLIRQHLETNG